MEAALLLSTAALALYRHGDALDDSRFLSQYIGAVSFLTIFTWKDLVFPNILYEVLFPPLVALATFPEHFRLNLIISLGAFPFSPNLLNIFSVLVEPRIPRALDHRRLLGQVGSALVSTSLSRTEVFLFSALFLNLLYNAHSVPMLYLRTFLFGSFLALWANWYWVRKIMKLSMLPRPYKRRPANAEEKKLRYAGCVLIGYLLCVVGGAASFLSIQLTELVPNSQPINSIALLFEYIFAVNPQIHIALMSYWGAVLALAIAFIQNNSLRWSVDVRRKAWHATIVIMFLPVGVIIDPAFTKLVMAIALTGFLLVEFIRVTTIPPFGKAIHLYILRYIDDRDTCGPIVVSHIFLIVGISIPIFLASSPAGIICLGMGDAMASIVGKRLGRFRWPGTKKTVEGSLAFVIAVMVGLAIYKHLEIYYAEFGFPVLSQGDKFNPAYFGTVSYDPFPRLTISKMAVVGAATSLLEAVGGMNDNVIVPIYMLVLLQLI